MRISDDPFTLTWEVSFILETCVSTPCTIGDEESEWNVSYWNQKTC